MRYTVYKTTNNINDRFYIGCHQTETVDDDYMGSGKILLQAIEKYGKENFTKVVLHVFDSQAEMFDTERQIVTEEFISRLDTYNLKLGGFGGSPKGRKQSLEERQRRSRALKGIGLGREVSKETRKKISKALTGYRHTDKTRQNVSRAMKGKRSHCKGRTYEEIYNGRAIEIRHKRSEEMQGNKNPNFGTCWIYHEDQKISKTIPKNEIQEFLDNGWIKGRKLKW